LARLQLIVRTVLQELETPYMPSLKKFETYGLFI
jgi:hypothetical protein